MKKNFGALMLALAILSVGSLVLAQQDIDKQGSCKYCGMDRKMFAHSRMLVEYEDGTGVGTCSIRCMAMELDAAGDRKVKGLWVGDHGTKKLIDARTAFWVVGGDLKGVMSKRAKWAFADEEDARRFIREHGGAPVSYDDALKAAREDLGGKKAKGAADAKGKASCNCCNK